GRVYRRETRLGRVGSVPRAVAAPERASASGFTDGRRGSAASGGYLRHWEGSAESSEIEADAQAAFDGEGGGGEVESGDQLEEDLEEARVVEHQRQTDGGARSDVEATAA